MTFIERAHSWAKYRIYATEVQQLGLGCYLEDAFVSAWRYAFGAELTS
jgi:hypothetical protein